MSRQSNGSAVRERPIAFSTPMVQAILSGRKTQTRRLCRPHKANAEKRAALESVNHCYLGSLGERLWVRERWAYADQSPTPGRVAPIHYFATTPPTKAAQFRWRPSIFMPRTASRILLQIKDLRLESLCGITDTDARAEGFDPSQAGSDPIQWFHDLWELLNKSAENSWLGNPQVWVIKFSILHIQSNDEN